MFQKKVTVLQETRKWWFRRNKSIVFQEKEGSRISEANYRFLKNGDSVLEKRMLLQRKEGIVFQRKENYSVWEEAYVRKIWIPNFSVPEESAPHRCFPGKFSKHFQGSYFSYRFCIFVFFLLCSYSKKIYRNGAKNRSIFRIISNI